MTTQINTYEQQANDFLAVKREWENVVMLYNEDELEQLREIQ